MAKMLFRKIKLAVYLTLLLDSYKNQRTFYISYVIKITECIYPIPKSILYP